MNPEPTIYVPDTLIRPTMPLVSIDGQSTDAIYDTTTSALINEQNSAEDITAYQVQALAGDYLQLIAVTAAFTDITA